MSNGGTPIRSSPLKIPSSVLTGRSPYELTALRHLAQGYSHSEDGAQRPVANVAHDLRSQHNVDVTVEDVVALLADGAAP